MRIFLIMAALAFSTMAMGANVERQRGEVMFQKRIAVFSPSALSGGTGPIPDPRGVKEIADVLSPYLTLTGDTGFLDISEIYSVRTVELSEKIGDDTTIKQVFSFDKKTDRASVISRLQDAVASAKSSASTTSITACVAGNFWATGGPWGFEACYQPHDNGQWIQHAYRHWLWGMEKF